MIVDEIQRRGIRIELEQVLKMMAKIPRGFFSGCKNVEQRESL